MNRELLEQPFGENQIKQREGNFGKMLDYVEGHTVIQRLNDAFDADWSFVIINHEIIKESDEVIVLGELSAGTIRKTQFGSSRITRARNTGDMVSLSDDLKSSATDSLKKCATMLGIGLHLYNKTNSPSQRNSGGNGGNGQGWNNNLSGNGGNGNGYQRNGKHTTYRAFFRWLFFTGAGAVATPLTRFGLYGFTIPFGIVEMLISPL